MKADPLTFDVRIVPHERTIRARSDQSVLDAALAAGLNLPHSCKSGHCASCRARLVSGEIEYPRGRPLGVTAEEAKVGQVLLCQARARSDLAVEARLIARVSEAEIKTLPCRIERKTLLAPDVMQVFLRLPSVEHLEFQAGQYLDVLLPGEAGLVKRRSFSIASPPHDSQLLELHVRRVAGGGFTGRLFDELERGALLRIEGPLGQFAYRDSTSPLLLIAGGTGFAPIKSILRHVLERGIRRDVRFYWGARTTADLYEAEQIRAWAAKYPRLTFYGVLSAQEAAQVEKAQALRSGWVHEIVLVDHPDLAEFDVYAAGPPAMIEAIRASFPGHGLAPERLVFDSFDYAPDAQTRP